MLATYRRVRYKASRTSLRVPLTWSQHRGLTPADVFLASFERSGNTWIRFLLVEALTAAPAEFDNVNSVIPEMGSHRTVRPVLPGGGRLIKTHERYRSEYRKAVYIVRDIRDVILSNYARDHAMGFASYFVKDRGFDDYLLQFLRGKVTRFGPWHIHVQSWLESSIARSQNLLVIRFEDMCRNAEEELAHILDFLGVHVDPAVVHAAVVNNSVEEMRIKEDRSTFGVVRSKSLRVSTTKENGRFVRSGLPQGWRSQLTTAQRQLIEHYVGDMLAHLGYPVGTGLGQRTNELSALSLSG